MSASPPHRLVQPPPGKHPRTFDYGRLRVIRTAEGYPLDVPDGWVLLPPGDAMLTRRVKAAGECWVMQEKVGRRTMTRGVWAPAERIAQLKAQVAETRNDPAYQKKIQAGRQKRAAQEAVYTEDFQAAVLAFLDFAERYADLAKRLARRVADHATPVGSGTVARTGRIPLDERARAAVVAWMRHHTTDYDRMTIPRIKGKRREVRRRLAKQSIARLGPYREGRDAPTDCRLRQALERA